MATTIVTKSGSGAPTASDLVAGELAVDLTNKRLYTEDSGGTVLEVGSNPYNFTANHDGSAKLATTATGIDITGTATATKLVSANGVLELDDNGSHNGIINSPASLFINIDSDDSSTGEDFVIAKDRTSTTGGTELFRVQEDGKVGIGTSSPNYPIHVEKSVDGDWMGKIKNTHATNGYGLLIHAGDDASVTALSVGNYAGAGDYLVVKGDGAVGIGQSTITNPYSQTPFTDVNINGTWGGAISFQMGGVTKGWVGQRSSGNEDMVIGATTGQELLFYENNAEAARISSGNLLVGKTALDNSTVGIRMNATGDASFVADGTRPLVLNRKTSDGDIALFLKDGTTVGSIGVTSGSLGIGQSNTGLGFFNTDSIVFPATAAGATRDAAIDLGYSGSRWKDLYLSGGVVFGDAGGSGTSTSNTLDSYEEGTFTPALYFGGVISSGAAYGNAVGTYTKIGNRVTYSLYLLMTNKGTTTGQFMVGGFPFPANAGGGAYNVTCPAIMNLISHTGQISCYQDGDLARFYSTATTGVRVTMDESDVSNTSEIMMSGTYYVV